MNYLCTDNFRFEKTKSNTIRTRITIEYKTEDRNFIFDKDLSIFWFIVISPFFILFALLALITSIVFTLIEPAPTAFPSYKEAKEQYQNGHSYLDSLSIEEKNKLFSKKEDLPLGL